MKRTLLAVLFLTLSSSLFAGRYKPTADDVNTFLKNTTYVVLESNQISSYNLKIKEAMAANWTLTKFEFISSAQFEQMRKDRDKSFLVLVDYKYPEENLSVNYTHFSAMNGSATSKVTDMPEVISIPVAYSKSGDASYFYKMEAFLRFFQQHILALKGNPKLLSADMLDAYNDNAPKVKTKELWVVEKDLEKDMRDITKQRKAYPYPVKVVTTEDIEDAIANKNENVMFIHKVGPEGQRVQERVYKMVFSASDGLLYYFDMHHISGSKPDGMLSSDLKKLAKK
jgi:hypothetical protein